MDWKFGLQKKKKFYCDSELWTFLWCLRASKFWKVLVQEGHANLTPQMVFVHMCTYSSLCGWQPSLHPSTQHLYTLLMPPTFRQRGIMWTGMATSKTWETAEEGASSASPIPSTAGAEASGSIPLDSWGGGLDMVAVGVWLHLLGGGGAEDMEDCDTAPLRSPYKPSASDTATANCNFCSPLFSSHCVSSLSALALLSKWSPWKGKKKWICHKGQAWP